VAVLWATAANDDVATVELRGPRATEVAAAIMAGDLPDWWPLRGLTVQGQGQPAEGTEVAVRAVVHPDDELSCARAESDLGLFAVEWLDGLVAVHAALVCADGVVVMLPGPSFAGKTTLCVAASEAGYDVYSDEYTLIDPATNLVVGWPRRLRVRVGSTGIERRQVCVPHDPVAVDLVAVVTYDADLDTPLDVQPLAPAGTTTSLLANTVCAASRPELSFGATVELARSTTAVIGRRGAAAPALAAMVALTKPPR
jgi:hypothetical protein